MQGLPRNLCFNSGNVMTRVLVRAVQLIVVSCLMGAAFAAEPISPESWVVFGSSDCEECAWLKSSFVSLLNDRYGDGVPNIVFVDVDEPGGYEALMKVETLVGSSGQTLPAMLAGEEMAYGKEDIVSACHNAMAASTLPRIPKGALPVLQGVHTIPLTEVSFGKPGMPPGLPGDPGTQGEGERDGSAEKASYRNREILYFETTGCKECARVEKQIAYLSNRFPHKKVARINALEQEGRVLQMAVARHLEIPAGERLTTPMVVSGQRALYGDRLHDAALIRLFRQASARPFWQTWAEKDELATARLQLEKLAGSLTLPTVIGAGLVDGINPCAFAVILFLVSYLTLTGNVGRRYALIYGFMFCLGVFSCYFLIGVGFLQVLNALQRWQNLAKGIFIATGVLCLLFAFGAAVDTVNAMRHGAGSMRFGMPKAARNLVHRLIRENVGKSLMGIGAFVVGVAISGLELVCTGQIYLPILIFINSTMPGSESLVLLALYNLAFIVPLLAVVVLGAGGLGSRTMSKWAEKHAVLMRGLTGVVVLCMAGVMFYLGLR